MVQDETEGPADLGPTHAAHTRKTRTRAGPGRRTHLPTPDPFLTPYLSPHAPHHPLLPFPAWVHHAMSTPYTSSLCLSSFLLYVSLFLLESSMSWMNVCVCSVSLSRPVSVVRVLDSVLLLLPVVQRATACPSPPPRLPSRPPETPHPSPPCHRPRLAARALPWANRVARGRCHPLTS